MSKEQWKDIPNYEGKYQVSTLGRVRSIERKVMQWNEQKKQYIEINYPMRYLKTDTIKGGYRRVTLSKDNKQERLIVHRLVAEAFIPNPEGKPHVHHRNAMTHDNRVDNLEWVTPIENERYKWMEKQPSFEAIDPNGNSTIWHTQMDCARGLGLPRNGIQRCLSGEVSSYRGYTFTYIRPLGE